MVQYKVHDGNYCMLHIMLYTAVSAMSSMQYMVDTGTVCDNFFALFEISKNPLYSVKIPR